MNKLIRYALLLFFGLLWFLGCSPTTVKWLGENGVIQDDYRFGDLYRFSNLREFRVPVQKCTAPKKTTNLPVHLVLFGDSFTEEGRIEANHFEAAAFTRNFVATDGYIDLQKNKKNILIIETVERHFRERFASVYTHVKVNQPKKPQPKPTLWENLLAWEVPYKTEMHESVLFSSDFFFTLKEWKAAINQRLFGRIDDNVVLSKNNYHLVYALAVKPGINSSFDAISDAEIKELVANVNATYQAYKKAGFDEVYLNIIPNKTSILVTDLGRYNHLIERIQQHPDLQMPFVDSYAALRKGGEKLFDKGDTHWNCYGKQLWVDDVNAKLRAAVKQN